MAAEVGKVHKKGDPMKRLLGTSIVLAIMISTLSFSVTPANAVFGLSKCEKVRAQVKAFEKQEKIFAKQYEPVNGIWSWFFTGAHLNKYWNLQKEIVDFEVAMFAYDLKNLTCFTVRQQKYAQTEYEEWRGFQKFIKNTPDWITGFAFIPIEWDSIYKA